MKYFVILMLLAGFVGFSIIVDDAYGLVIPLSPEELLEQSQAIFVGNITSVNVLEFEKSSTYYTEEDGIEKQVIENYTLSLDEYTVSVEEFLKNPQNSTTLTLRQPTTSIPGRDIPIGGFELGDRVLFYIQNLDDVNEYSFESFKIPKKCDANSVVLQSKLAGTDFNMLQNGMKKQDNFTANLPITFVFASDTRTLYGKSFVVEIFVSKQEDKTFSNRVFHEKISAGSEICEWIGIAKSEFTLDSGKYLLNGNISDDDSRLSFSNQFSVVPQSPLKQFKSGIPIHEIECKESLFLMEKHDGTPVCVKPLTAEKLIQRGWGIIPDNGNSKTSVPINFDTIDFSKTINANNQFAFDYYTQVNENQNIFFSPWSITSAFAIVNEGAKGNTADEIQNVFGLDENSKENFKVINKILNQEKPGYIIEVANSLWLAQDFTLHTDYVNTVQTFYDGVIEKVDFADDGTDVINGWVSDKTRQKIPKLFDPPLDPNTRLVIANAIYFNGTWSMPFDEKNTRDDKFIISPGVDVTVPFMSKDSSYRHTTTDELQIIELPYEGNAASMLVLLPERIDGMKSLEAQLTAENLAKWRSEMTKSRLFLQIPKFTLETEYNLVKDLMALGIEDAFGPADFSGISSESLFIDRAVHKAFVDVNEKGTEAAAATGIAMTESMPPTFRVDHPFVFVILDNETETILFIGKVVDPSQ